MKRKGGPALERLQDSVSYYPDTAFVEKADIPDRSKYFQHLYTHMFIEDVKLGIMPIGGRTLKKQFTIALEPSDTNWAQIVESALSPREYHHGLASEVCDFVAQCAVELLLFDTSTYEIVYLSEQKSGKLAGFEFVHINPVTIVQRGNNLLQVLPNELAAELGKPGQIELKPERILAFHLPSGFQGKMDELMELISILSSPVAPDFYMKEMASGSMKTPYEVKTHIYRRKVALASATKLYGWNARLAFQEEALEYYLIHRSLLFEHFKIGLRESILETLNQGIKRAGGQLGFDTKIIVIGLPTLNDVKIADDHLQKGDLRFAEIMETFRV